MTVVILEDAELYADRWFDDDDPLTDEQKALLDARFGRHGAESERVHSLGRS